MANNISRTYPGPCIPDSMHIISEQEEVGSGVPSQTFDTPEGCVTVLPNGDLVYLDTAGAGTDNQYPQE